MILTILIHKRFKEPIEGGIMAKKILTCLVGVFLVVFMVSCAKLPENKVETPVVGKFGMESLKLSDSIPLKWGNLIAVSNSINNPDFTRWWFQDKEGNIYIVWYNMSTNKFLEEYRFLKRR
jgi:hypothetical protein